MLYYSLYLVYKGCNLISTFDIKIYIKLFWSRSSFCMLPFSKKQQQQQKRYLLNMLCAIAGIGSFALFFYRNFL